MFSGQKATFYCYYKAKNLFPTFAPACCIQYLLNASYLLFFFALSCIFILLSRAINQRAMQARLGVAIHLSTTPRWGNLAQCSFLNDTASKLAGLFFTLFL